MLKKSIVKTAGVYTGANIVNAMIPFFLLPVLTRYLTPADYGITAIMQVLISLITPFVGLNLHGAIAAKYYRKDEINFSKYVSNCFWILCFSSIFMTAIFVFFSRHISQWTAFPIEWLWTILLICFGQFLIGIVLTVLQISIRAKFYALMQISQTILNVSLSLWLILVLNFNWQGRVIAQVITVVVFMIIGIFLLKRWGLLSWSYDLAYIKDALSFGLPLIPHALSGCLVLMVDRFLITNLVSVEATGIYAVGVQVGMVIQLLANSFNQAYSPWLYQNLAHITDEKKKKIVRLTYLYFICILLVASVVSLALPTFLQFFLGEKFYKAADYIYGIALAGAFQGMYYMVGFFIFYVGKTRLLACITFGTSIMHIFNTYWAIRWFGAIGATYSSALTAFVTFVLVWSLSSRVYPMPWLIKIRLEKEK